MDKKFKIFLILFISVIAIIAILFFIFKTPKQVIENNEVIPMTDTVYLTDAGFEPSKIKVKANTEVKFINESDKPMWISSNPHSDELDYPEFKDTQAREKDEEYTFTFSKVGE